MRALLCLLLLPSIASADGHEITFGTDARAMRSSSADALTGDALVGAHLELGRALDLGLPHHLVVWADADAIWSGAKGTMFDEFATTLFSTTLTGGLRLRYQPIRNLGISAGVAFGAQHASLTLTDSTDHEADDGAWGAVARASVKLDLLAVDKPKFGLGIRGELGYLAAQGVELVPKQQRADDGTLYIPMTEASLGHLDLGGPYVNISLLTQF